MSDFLRSTVLLLVLLNPFLLIIYLTDVVEKLDRAQFARVLIRAGLIATAAFWSFALLGDAIFSSILQAEFASFQIFGGVVFLLIGLQFVFRGTTAIEILRGESKHLLGAIAMPILIGPGTISASIIIGKRLTPPSACAAVFVAVLTSVLILIGLKAVHDYVRPRREPLIRRYIEIAGRITALFVGTISVEMIMQESEPGDRNSDERRRAKRARRRLTACRNAAGVVIGHRPHERLQCERRDLNPHGFHHWILNPARLPIPPLSQNKLYCLSHNNLRPISSPPFLACSGPMLPKLLPTWGLSARFCGWPTNRLPLHRPSNRRRSLSWSRYGSDVPTSVG